MDDLYAKYDCALGISPVTIYSGVNRWRDGFDLTTWIRHLRSVRSLLGEAL